MHLSPQLFQPRVKKGLSIKMICNDPLTSVAIFPNYVCLNFSSFGQPRALFSTSNSADDITIPLSPGFVITSHFFRILAWSISEKKKHFYHVLTRGKRLVICFFCFLWTQLLQKCNNYIFLSIL